MYIITESRKLSAGNHFFKFNVQLPTNIPPSYEDTYGKIFYKAVAKLEFPPNTNSDLVVKETLKVISPVDLNLIKHLKNPLSIEKKKYFCCFWCLSGPVILVTSIPTRGYIPGQDIHLIVEMENASNVAISCLICEFVKITTYYSNKHKSSKEEITIIGKEVLEISEQNYGIWPCKITVPAYLTPSFLRKCKIIDVKYQLKIRAKPVQALREVENVLPIIIGTTQIIKKRAS